MYYLLVPLFYKHVSCFPIYKEGWIRNTNIVGSPIQSLPMGTGNCYCVELFQVEVLKLFFLFPPTPTPNPLLQTDFSVSYHNLYLTIPRLSKLQFRMAWPVQPSKPNKKILVVIRLMSIFHSSITDLSYVLHKFDQDHKGANLAELQLCNFKETLIRKNLHLNYHSNKLILFQII